MMRRGRLWIVSRGLIEGSIDPKPLCGLVGLRFGV